MSDLPFTPGDRFDLCIIGAGVSGLSLAQMASGRLGLRALVLESRPEPGGCLNSVPLPSPEAPTGWLELGAHTCYNSYGTFLGVLEATGLLAQTVSRRGLGYRLMEHGAIRSIMACVNPWEAAWCLPRLFRERKEGQTVAGYYARILGRRNWERVLHPMLNAVASQETGEFPADALFKRRAGRRKDVLRSFSVRGGLGAAARALATLPGVHCALGREAVALVPVADGYQVRTQREETFHARRVALAVPADAARNLLAGPFPGLAERLARIETRTVRTLGVVFRNPLAHLPRLAGLVFTEGPCRSAVSGDAVPVPGHRAWSFHFDGALIDDDPELMLDYACRMLQAPREQVLAWHRRDHLLPAPKLGHDAWLADLQRELAGGDLMLLGNYLTGMAIEDCAGRAREEYERVLADPLRPGGGPEFRAR